MFLDPSKTRRRGIAGDVSMDGWLLAGGALGRCRGWERRMENGDGDGEARQGRWRN